MRVYRKQRKLNIEAILDSEGNGAYEPIPTAPLEVREGQGEKLFLVAPSYARTGMPVELIAYAEDRWGNVCETFVSRLSVSAESGKHVVAASYLMRAWDRDRALDRNAFSLIFPAPGVYYVRAADLDSDLSAISNPVYVTDGQPAEMLAWGEIHVHSQISDGKGETGDIYRDGYARGLDFIAITDHDFGRPARGSLADRLRHICREAERFHRDGSYVTIPAGEMHWFPRTHMNIYFPEIDPGRIESAVTRLNSLPWPEQWESLDPGEMGAAADRFWSALAELETDLPILCFTHHSMWQGMTNFLNDDRMRVIEIHSIHGSSETRDPDSVPAPLRIPRPRLEMFAPYQFSVREALDAGFRLGFVGGSDNHDGQPGVNALTAVRVPELTRPALFQSLAGRRCYATTANRTLVEFRADRAAMGEVRETGDITFSCLVAGDGRIDTVEIIGNGRVVYRHDPEKRRTTEFTWQSASAEPGYYYVRVFLNDGRDAAWSSPVWLDEPKTEEMNQRRWVPLSAEMELDRPAGQGDR